MLRGWKGQGEGSSSKQPGLGRTDGPDGQSRHVRSSGLGTGARLADEPSFCEATICCICVQLQGSAGRYLVEGDCRAPVLRVLYLPAYGRYFVEGERDAAIPLIGRQSNDDVVSSRRVDPVPQHEAIVTALVGGLKWSRTCGGGYTENPSVKSDRDACENNGYRFRPKLVVHMLQRDKRPMANSGRHLIV